MMYDLGATEGKIALRARTEKSDINFCAVIDCLTSRMWSTCLTRAVLFQDTMYKMDKFLSRWTQRRWRMRCGESEEERRVVSRCARSRRNGQCPNSNV